METNSNNIKPLKRWTIVDFENIMYLLMIQPERQNH